MLNYNTSIKQDKIYSDLEIKEIKPIMKLIIRGKTKDFITAIGKNLNMILPTEANTSTANYLLSVLALGLTVAGILLICFASSTTHNGGSSSSNWFQVCVGCGSTLVGIWFHHRQNAKQMLCLSDRNVSVKTDTNITSVRPSAVATEDVEAVAPGCQGHSCTMDYSLLARMQASTAHCERCKACRELYDGCHLVHISVLANDDDDNDHDDNLT